MTLTKSDFKIARTCATKLYFRKRKYPTTAEEDEYLQFLADGGYMVEALARLHFPDGREMSFSAGMADAAKESAAAFEADNATLFEATFASDPFMLRTDILDRQGASVRVIEVKAKSIDTSVGLGKTFCSRNGIRPEWRPYLEDVAFQVFVLRRLHPTLSISALLCMPDKSKTTGIDLLHKHFTFTVDANSKFRRPVVEFIGDREAAVRDSFLAFVDVTEWVDRILPEVAQEAERFAVELECGSKKAPPVIGTRCSKCEYRVEGREPSGFADCWGALAHASPHVLDFYNAGNLGGRGGPVVQGLLAKGEAGLADVMEADITNAKGEVGSIAKRQLLQREYTLRNEEFLSDQLPALLAAHSYPLHFIDFEASRIAIPYHAGMRPYEQVCFQWSCHTIRQPGAALEHSEWINVEDSYPNLEFARTLAEKIGDQGTVYIWSKFEMSALREIREQAELYNLGDEALRNWLNLFLGDHTGGQLSVVDMCELAKWHYFHPLMGGRLSIKYVLPAVWSSNSSLWAMPVFAEYYRLGEDGRPASPYSTLPNLPFGDEEATEGEAEAVREGTGAVRAYQDMLYGLAVQRPAQKEAWRKALLQYCKLDTAAMVMIWHHWSRLA